MSQSDFIKRLAIYMGRRALNISNMATKTAYLKPSALETLVAPMLPLPVFLISTLFNLEIRYPKGIEPHKYPARMKITDTYVLIHDINNYNILGMPGFIPDYRLPKPA